MNRVREGRDRSTAQVSTIRHKMKLIERFETAVRTESNPVGKKVLESILRDLKADLIIK